MAHVLDIKRRGAMNMIKMTPLPASFMLTAMLGLIITTVYTTYNKIGLSWGIAFDIVFGLMFFASILSITPSGPQAGTAVADRTAKKGKKSVKHK